MEQQHVHMYQKTPPEMHFYLPFHKKHLSPDKCQPVILHLSYLNYNSHDEYSLFPVIVPLGDLS